MPVSLHTAVIESYLQLLPSVRSLVEKAKEHCENNAIQPESLCGEKLVSDMWDFAKQVDQSVHHSQHAIEGVRDGLFRPGPEPAPHDFGTLTRTVDEAIAFLESVPSDELDRIAERDVRFEMGKFVRDFTVADFLLSFSLPNFYFHATSAYAILRMKGLPLGKVDYLGKFRAKPRG